MIEKRNRNRKYSVRIVLFRDESSAYDHHRYESDHREDDHLEDVCIIIIHEIRSGDRTKGEEGERQHWWGENYAKIHQDRCRKTPIPKPGKKAQDPYEDTGGGYQQPERDRTEKTKERVDYIHEKADEHQRGEREADSIDDCLGNTEMVNPKNPQEKETRYEGKEEETSDLPDERNREAKDIKSYEAPEGKEER